MIFSCRSNHKNERRQGHHYCYEVIIVDDGSIDGSREFLDDLAEKDKNCKIIYLRRNCGQTAAMMAGIDR